VGAEPEETGDERAPAVSEPIASSPSSEGWLGNDSIGIRVDEIQHHSSFSMWTAKPGHHFVSLNVACRNPGPDRDIALKLTGFHLESEDGQIFWPGLAAPAPPLRAVRLQPGTEVSGWLTFYVPSNVRERWLVLAPELASEEMKVDLKTP
jgi:hypothetical protein